MKRNRQKVYQGIGTIQLVKEVIEKFGGKRVFLVTGKNSFKECGAEKSLKISLHKFIVNRFYNFSNNPRIEEINEGIIELRKFSPDIVIAIGGGSVIDIAKAINILSDQKEYFEYYIRGDLALTGGGFPLLAIPTTSGTGSEATHFSVVYMNKLKYSLAHKSMLPTVAIVDPALTFDLSPEITAVTGADALSQALESYWSIKSTEESKKYAKGALVLAIRYLRDAVRNPTESSRVGMSESAHLAGKAINISKTTASHALSYPLTAHFGIPHGHAVACTLSRLLIYNSEVTEIDLNDPRGLRYVIHTVNEIARLFGAESPYKASKIIDRLFQDIGLEMHLRKLGIFPSHLDLLLGGVSIERMANNPRKMSLNHAKTLFENSS